MTTMIFSAELSSLNWKDNFKRTMELYKYLELYNYNYEPVEGVYKNTTEISFKVTNLNKTQVKLLLNMIFNKYKQESVLLVNKDKQSYLIYSDLKKDYIGEFTKVNKDLAMNQVAYTKINNEYYVAM